MKKINLLFLAVLIAIGSKAQWNALNSGTTENITILKFLDSQNGFYGYGASTTSGGIKKTTDGGKTWTNSLNTGTIAIWNMTFFNSNSGLACGNNGNIYSWNGLSWTGIGIPSGWSNGFDAWQIGFKDAVTGWVVGAGGMLYKTTNGGVSWSSVDYGQGTATLRNITFLDANTGFMAGSGGYLLKTTDGGTIWNPVATKTKDDFRFVGTAAPSTLWYSCSNGTVNKTVDAGTTWSTYSVGTAATINNDLSVIDANTVIVSSNTANKVFYTSDGGNSWNFNTIGGTSYRGIHFIDDVTGWIAGNAGAIYKTVSGYNAPSITPAFSGSTVDAAANSSTSISITANGRWTAESNASWLKVTTSEGLKNGTISVTALTTSPTQRTATVTVSMLSYTKTFTVTQLPTITVSISQKYDVSQVNVYPTSTENALTVKIENDYIGKIEVFVYNTAGRMLRNNTYSKIERNAVFEVNVSEMNQGIYFLKIKHGNNIVTKKFSKM